MKPCLLGRNSCTISTLVVEHKNLTCGPAVMYAIYGDGWTINKTKTLQYNGWGNDISKLVENIQQGRGLCFLDQ